MKRHAAVLSIMVIVSLATICLAAAFPYAAYAQAIPDFRIVRVNGEGVIDKKGDLNISMTCRFPTNADYMQVKSMFPSPYVLLRDTITGRAGVILDNADARYDDAANSIIMSGTLRGASVYRRRAWESSVGRNLELVWQDPSHIVLCELTPLSGYFMFSRYHIQLPAGAMSARYSPDSGIISYSLPIPAAPGAPEMDIDTKVKPRLMSATYKAYGKSEITDGSSWVARTAVTNVGQSNIRDMEISYKLGEYSDWSPAGRYSIIPPGGTVVDLYYPIISSKVAELRSSTPVDVSVRFSYKDESGHAYTDSETRRISMLGINQFETSNLLPEEQTGSWHDMMSNVPLLAAWFTKVDEPVKAFAGLVSQAAGGAGAAIDDESALQFMKALFDMEVAHGISYQTPSSGETDYSFAQDVKFPRDVLRDKAGTCVDLAITYGSVCEAVGLRAYLILIPRHAYPIIRLPSGQMVPVETTCVGGAAVGKSTTFEEAVKTAQKNIGKDTQRPHYIVDIEAEFSEGLSSPELPRLDSDIITRWGYKLPQAAAAQPAVPGGAALYPTTPQAMPPTTPPTTPPMVPPVTPPGQTGDLSGDYKGQIRIASGPGAGSVGNVTLALQQSGSAVQGQLRFDPPGQGGGPIQGQVQGNTLVFLLQLQSQAGSIMYQFQCVVQDGVIQGTFKCQQGEEDGQIAVQKV